MRRANRAADQGVVDSRNGSNQSRIRWHQTFGTKGSVVGRLGEVTAPG